MQPNEITEVLNRPISQELLTPTWARLLDFETTLPSAVEELVRQRAERQRD